MSDKSELMNQPIPENAWVKSTYSGAGSGGDCVEVAALEGGAAIRDSKNPQGGVLRFSAADFEALIAMAKDSSAFAG